MKNLNLKVISVVLIMMFSFPTTATEYIVQSGDTLERVAKFTEHSINQLVAMSNIYNIDKIAVGQKIRWISSVDMQYARSWCARQSNFGNSGEIRYHHSVHYMYLIKNLIIYDDNPNGVHFSKVHEYVAKEIARISSLANYRK